MSKLSGLELWHLLHNLEVRHWYDVNLNGGQTVHELYAEDGILAVGASRHSSRTAIREFYIARAKRGVRTARHVVMIFQILPGENKTSATAAGIVSLYAGDQAPPLESLPAVLMADMTNTYVLESDGLWRYQSHILRPVFLGSDPFVNAAVTGKSQNLG
jgi:hypothetical protein